MKALIVRAGLENQIVIRIIGPAGDQEHMIDQEADKMQDASPEFTVLPSDLLALGIQTVGWARKGK